MKKKKTRCRARRERLEVLRTFNRKNGSSQGQNLALTVVIVPYSIEALVGRAVCHVDLYRADFQAHLLFMSYTTHFRGDAAAPPPSAKLTSGSCCAARHGKTMIRARVNGFTLGKIRVIHSVEFEGLLGRKFDRNVTKLAPHKALKLIARCKLTFDERVVLQPEDVCNSWVWHLGS